MFVQTAGWVASIMCDSGVGISSQQKTKTFVHTSPTGKIEIYNAKQGTVATLFSLSGSKLIEKGLNASTEIISTHSLPEGIYLLRLTSDTETKVYKILLRK
jgi:hypothetical protein